MNLKYKYLSTNPAESCVEVRFYTDILTEDMLVQTRNPDGSIQRCRSDLNIMLPFPAPTGAELESYITQHAPTQWFENMERSVAGTVDGVYGVIGTIIGQEYMIGEAPLTGVAVQTTPTTLSAAKDRKLAWINMYRERVLASGVVYNGYQFDSDALSVQRLTAVATAVNAGIPLPAGFTWRSAANVDVPMTGQDIIALLATMMGRADEVYKTSWAKKQQIEAATTQAEVEAVTWVEPGVL